ncbi:MAG: peptidoglycan-binding protein [Rhodocyclaceae bacterium]|nr:peptidoglycan-binding protein [Thauera sp.]MBX3685158.1 peptidoglycan-binding protein [Rhodocyclaceae bacterium]MCP5240496.1 peptidoglycan-binding protein [Zoogloeaceae bacterium]MCB1911133.1 peptidoglycan-binding protein [Rhodocyclaceae bacterium]MCP5253403.1 peptidoglycan-binding protein [Zoogloeaceae bacterium]
MNYFRKSGLKLASFALGVVLLASSTANAADAKGGFAVEGAGAQSCETFLKAKANGGNDLAIFAGWVDGYLTGANQHAPQTYDFTPWQTVGLLIAALANHCEKEPKRPFIVAVNNMLAALKAERMQERSETVKIEADGRSGLFYKTVMEDAQKRLAAEKLYKGTIDGSFGPTTEAAFKAFQKREGLKESGLPDQATLFKLFVKK